MFRPGRVIPRGTNKPRWRIKKTSGHWSGNAIPQHARDKPIELWWQDEARVGQQGTLTYVWTEKGSRPTAPRDQRYKWAYIFGAVCPARQVAAGLVLPKADAAMMNLHLIEISSQVAPGAHAVIVLDKAGWHRTGGRLIVPENISLLLLPPLLARTQSRRERMAVPAPELSGKSRLRKLQRHRRGLL